jgi:hypothetical protein
VEDEWNDAEPLQQYLARGALAYLEGLRAGL